MRVLFYVRCHIFRVPLQVVTIFFLIAVVLLPLGAVLLVYGLKVRLGLCPKQIGLYNKLQMLTYTCCR